MTPISIVQGNDFILLVKLVVKGKKVTDEPTALDFSSVDDLCVNLRRGLSGKTYPMTVMTTNDANIIKVACIDVPVGVYSIEIKGKKGAQNIRAFERSMLCVVSTNHESHTPVRYYEGEQSDMYDIQIQLTDWDDTCVVSSRVYSDITLAVTYPKASAGGGTLAPTVTYTQTETVTYANGTQDTNTITSGGVLTFSGAETDGKVTISASTMQSEHVAKTVTASVSLNGKIATKSVDILQAAYVPSVSYKMYMGDITASKSAFTALTTNELLSDIEAKDITATTEGSAVAEKNCYVILIPSALSIVKFAYTSGGMTTDVLGGNLWNLTHADIVIEGVTYKVYGYRLATVTEGNPQVYDYKIRIG